HDGNFLRLKRLTHVQAVERIAAVGTEEIYEPGIAVLRGGIGDWRSEVTRDRQAGVGSVCAERVIELQREAIAQGGIRREHGGSGKWLGRFREWVSWRSGCEDDVWNSNAGVRETMRQSL